MRRTILILAGVLLAGCSRTWDRPGATPAQFNQEAYECERDTRAVSASFGGGLAGGLFARDFMDRCMKARGWYLRDK